MAERLLSNERIDKRSIKQLKNSALSIGANLEEARGAQSRADFYSKVSISLKEARESHYWLRTVSASSDIKPVRFEAIIKEANEIVAILTTIARKTNPRKT